jgi:hypothetical protein
MIAEASWVTHASHSLQGPSNAGGRFALGEQAFFLKFSAHTDISLTMAARAFSLA